MSVHLPIQIVDENGGYIGLAAGPLEAIANKQIRAISRVTLSNPEGTHFLLQKRSSTMKRMPGMWDHSAAGHVDEGESAEEAAYREMSEEIGVRDCVLQLDDQMFREDPIEPDGGQNRTYNYFYSGIFDGDIKSLTLDPTEVSEVKWFSKSEILELIQAHPESVTDGVKIYFKEAG
jgi:isopentenyldiphosphate isomerase